MASPQFHINQKIFAIICGYPPWPGKILNFFPTSNEVRYLVYLYGLDISEKFAAEQLTDFSDFVLNNTFFLGTQNLFVKAIDQVQNEIINESNSNKFSLLNTSENCDWGNKRQKKRAKVLKLDEKYKPEQFINSASQSSTSENQISNQKTSLPYERQILSQLTETKLLFCDYKIKSSLTSDSAEYENALAALNGISKLRLNKHVLKKHPHILETISKLRKYVGNDGKGRGRRHGEAFAVSPAKIRAKADQIYKSFKKMLTTDDLKPDNDGYQNQKDRIVYSKE